MTNISEKGKKLREKTKLYREIKELKNMQFNDEHGMSENIYKLIQKKMFRYKLVCQELKDEKINYTK